MSVPVSCYLFFCVIVGDARGSFVLSVAKRVRSTRFATERTLFFVRKAEGASLC